LEYVCNPELVDDYVRLFYPLVFAMGCQQEKNTKNSSAKKGKKEMLSSFLQRHFRLFQSAQFEVLD
jgi:hypothetical protein